MSGEDISLKKKSLVQTADNLSNPGSTPYTETQRMVLRLAKNKAQKAIELAEIQAEAKEAKAKVDGGTAKVNDYINNAMNLRPVDENGNIESDTFGYEAVTAELANNILETFNEEEQDVIIEYNALMEADGDSYVLDAMALDLINNFDDEDTLDSLISEYSKDEDSEFHEFLTTTYTKATKKELDTITKYMNRLAQALKKINNLGAAEDAFKEADKELEKAIQKEAKEKPSDVASVVGKSAEQRVKEFDALRAEIDDVFDKETGKVDAQKKFKLLAKADELRKIPDGFNAKDADKVFDAYDDFRDELDTRTNEGVKFSVRESKLGKALYQAAWHGTPHIIEGGRLTTAKVGTGEKAIVHGWGLYFAKDRDIAQTRYRERLVNKSPGVTWIKIENPETGEKFSWEANLTDKLFTGADAEENKLSPTTKKALKLLKARGGNVREASISWRRHLADLKKALDDLLAKSPQT